MRLIFGAILLLTSMGASAGECKLNVAFPDNPWGTVGGSSFLPGWTVRILDRLLSPRGYSVVSQSGESAVTPSLEIYYVSICYEDAREPFRPFSVCHGRLTDAEGKVTEIEDSATTFPGISSDKSCFKKLIRKVGELLPECS